MKAINKYLPVLIVLAGIGFMGPISSQSIWDSIKEKGNEIYEKGKQITGSDSCRDYSDYTCSQLENSRYNVYVWLAPSKFGDEPFTVGTSNSLSQCSSMARNFAYRKDRKMDDYICCLITKDSSCAEKHR